MKVARDTPAQFGCVCGLRSRSWAALRFCQGHPLVHSPPPRLERYHLGQKSIETYYNRINRGYIERLH